MEELDFKPHLSVQEDETNMEDIENQEEQQLDPKKARKGGTGLYPSEINQTTRTVDQRSPGQGGLPNTKPINKE